MTPDLYTATQIVQAPAVLCQAVPAESGRSGANAFLIHSTPEKQDTVAAGVFTATRIAACLGITPQAVRKRVLQEVTK